MLPNQSNFGGQTRLGNKVGKTKSTKNLEGIVGGKCQEGIGGVLEPILCNSVRISQSFSEPNALN